MALAVQLVITRSDLVRNGSTAAGSTASRLAAVVRSAAAVIIAAAVVMAAAMVMAAMAVTAATTPPAAHPVMMMVAGSTARSGSTAVVGSAAARLAAIGRAAAAHVAAAVAAIAGATAGRVDVAVAAAIRGSAATRVTTIFGAATARGLVTVVAVAVTATMTAVAAPEQAGVRAGGAGDDHEGSKEVCELHLESPEHSGGWEHTDAGVPSGGTDLTPQHNDMGPPANLDRPLASPAGDFQTRSRQFSPITRRLCRKKNRRRIRGFDACYSFFRMCRL